MWNFEILQYLTKICVLKYFRKVNIIKATAGLELITYRLVVNDLTNCTMLLDNNYRTENIVKITLDFYCYFNRTYVTIRRYPIPPWFPSEFKRMNGKSKLQVSNTVHHHVIKKLPNPPVKRKYWKSITCTSGKTALIKIQSNACPQRSIK